MTVPNKEHLQGLVEELRNPSQWCCIFEHEGETRHGTSQAPFKAADTLESLAAENERLTSRIEATRKVIDEGYPGQPTGKEKCPHGRFSWEDCMTCYDEALLEALSGGGE